MKHIFKNSIKTFLFIIATVGFIASSSVVTQAQAVPAAKIMFIDFTRVTQESLVGQDVAAQLDSNRVKLETRAGNLDQQLQLERQELQRQQSIIAPDAFEERVRGFQQRQLSAQNELEQLNNQHQRAAQQASLEIQRVLRPIIISVMDGRGATIVMDKNTVYHSIGGLDGTTTVIEKLNAALSSFAVTFPSVQAPAATK